MGILWCDSFNSYGTTADMTKMYGSNPTAAITLDLTNGPSSDPVVKLTAGTSNAIMTTTIIRAAGTMIGGRFQFKASAVPGANVPLLSIGNINSSGAATASDWSIGPRTSTGRIGCGIAGSSSVLTYTGTSDVCNGIYHLIEFQVDAQNSSLGSVKVWVDTVLEINQTGINAFSGTPHATQPWDTTMTLSSLSSGATVRYINDLIIFDSDGVAGTMRTADQPHGTLVIATLRPSGAGSSTQFTPSAGSNYQCVDEVAQNGATDYVSSQTSGHRDLYAMGDLGVVPTTVYGYVAKVYADNPGGGTISMVHALKSGATTSTSVATVANITGDYVVKVYDTDPQSGGIPWTQTNVDAVEQGFDVV